MVETGPGPRQYTVRMDGSRNVSIRNRKFLRPFPGWQMSWLRRVFTAVLSLSSIQIMGMIEPVSQSDKKRKLAGNLKQLILVGETTVQISPLTRNHCLSYQGVKIQVGQLGKARDIQEE